MIALGGYQSAVPPACWNTTGFRDCASLTWSLAQQACANIGKPGDDCAGPLYDYQVMAGCPCDPPRAPEATAAAAAAATADDDMDWAKVAAVGAIALAAYLAFR